MCSGDRHSVDLISQPFPKSICGKGETKKKKILIKCSLSSIECRSGVNRFILRRESWKKIEKLVRMHVR